MSKVTVKEIRQLETSFETPERQIDDSGMIKRLADYLETINPLVSQDNNRIYEVYKHNLP